MVTIALSGVGFLPDDVVSEHLRAALAVGRPAVPKCLPPTPVPLSGARNGLAPPLTSLAPIALEFVVLAAVSAERARLLRFLRTFRLPAARGARSGGVGRGLALFACSGARLAVRLRRLQVQLLLLVVMC
jgi:hypothetical protein